MDLYAHLAERLPWLKLEADFDFSRHTSIGCGGRAAVAAYPSDAEEAAALLYVLAKERIPHCILGTGSNVLPRDGALECVVVRLSRLSGLYADQEEIFAGAGVTGGRLLAFACGRGIGGFSAFSGIPMSVGGGTAMNAGVRERHFSDVVVRVLCAERGEIHTLSCEECCFGEKTSLFLSGIPVLGVWLRGTRARPSDIARESCYYRRRRMSLPKGRSMGCTFVNPSDISAGELIERCGLKGARRGGAFVSEKHANFVMNEGGSSSDVAALIAYIKTEVARRTGIVLREEIRYLP